MSFFSLSVNVCKNRLAVLSAVAEDVVHDDECGHRVDDGDGTGEDAGVVAAGGGEFYGLFVAVYGVLLFCDG